ncbi:MAG: DUF1385 domain-containing protein [Eggerthella lenta]
MKREQHGRAEERPVWAFSENGALKTHVGGQALIEGHHDARQVQLVGGRAGPDGGIYVEEHDLASGARRTVGCTGRSCWMPSYAGVARAGLQGARDRGAACVRGKGKTNLRRRGGGGVCSSDSPARTNSPLDCSARAELASDPSRPLGDGIESSADADADGGDDARLEPVLAGEGEEERAFSWKEDFGRPDTMIDALGAQRSLEVVSEPESSPESQSQPEPAKKSFMDEEVEFGKKEMAVSMVLGLVLGVVLFIVAPAFITNLIVGEYDQNTVLWNIVDGLLRVGVFVFYLWLIGRMQEIKRMFGYHGAEHKTIHCYEHGLPLTPENARSFPRLHVRCGTAFLIMVMVIAIFVYTVTPINGLIELWGVPDGAPKLALVILVRILLMPVIAGISYEITVKWAGSNPDNPLVKVVLWPGMQMQYLTTNEPDDGQIECAIAAMQKVLEREEAEEAGEKAAAGAPDNADEPATATA